MESNTKEPYINTNKWVEKLQYLYIVPWAFWTALLTNKNKIPKHRLLDFRIQLLVAIIDVKPISVVSSNATEAALNSVQSKARQTPSVNNPHHVRTASALISQDFHQNFGSFSGMVSRRRLQMSALFLSTLYYVCYISLMPVCPKCPHVMLHTDLLLNFAVNCSYSTSSQIVFL